MHYSLRIDDFLVKSILKVLKKILDPIVYARFVQDVVQAFTGKTEKSQN